MGTGMLRSENIEIELWLDLKNNKIVLYRKKISNRILYFKAKPMGAKLIMSQQLNRYDYEAEMKKYKPIMEAQSA